MKKRTTAALSVVAAATLGLSACAEDAGGDSSSSQSDSGPIKLMVIEAMTGPTGVDQTIPESADATAQSINDDGGINGRDIEVLSCDTASDPNKSGECAREAISEGVAAVVGSFDVLGTAAMLPILESAGIPYLGQLALSDVDFLSPVSFPITAGAAAGIFGIPQLAADTGCEKTGLIGDPNLDQVGSTVALYERMKDDGLDVYMVGLPTGTADVTPAVGQLVAEDPDCIIFAEAAQTAVQVFSAVRQTGSDAQFISATGVVIEPLLPAYGEVAEGLLATSENLLLDHPDLQPFHDIMDEYAPDVEPSNFTLFGWQAVTVFAQAAEGLDEVNSETVLDALNSMEEVEIPGYPTVDFSEPRDSETFPRLFQPNVRYVQVEGGKYVGVDDEWHDVSEAIS